MPSGWLARRGRQRAPTPSPQPKGKLIWATQAGLGGVLGGIEWGTSTDGERIYAAISNGSHKTYTYTTFDGQKKTTTGGLWTALDPATGKILWQTGAPEDPEYITDGFVSSAYGVVYAGSSSDDFYAFNAKTGRVAWRFPSGGAVWSGAAIVGGVEYWGSGYNTEAREMPCDGNNNNLSGQAIGKSSCPAPSLPAPWPRLNPTASCSSSLSDWCTRRRCSWLESVDVELCGVQPTD